MKKVAVIDYGMGNLDSVARAVEECGGKSLITSKGSDLRTASCFILPGVGSFADGMRNIRNLGLYQVIREEVTQNGIPILGICLGMQLLATEGSEGGRTEGLDLIAGKVLRFQPTAPSVKIPHVGWNEVNIAKESVLFDGIPSGKDFYFVHSYSFIPQNEHVVVARTPYCGNFISAINRDNIFGVQFHPEKSLRAGLRLLKNFLSL